MTKTKQTKSIPIHEKMEMAIVDKNNPAYLLELAIQNKADIEQLGKLMDLHDRYQKKMAQTNYLFAMSIFQSQCPVMKKNKKVKYTSQKTGSTTEYNYATLGSIDETIKPILHKNGLSKRWEFTDKGELLECACIISHIDGHSERTVMSASKDDSGGKNAIQQRGSTITYLQRYTLIGALGISTGEDDVDGLKPKEEKTEGEEEIDLKELLELKKNALPEVEYKRAKEIIRKKEKASYLKLRSYLQTL